MQNSKMEFVLKGFSQVREFRVFAYERIAADWTRTEFTVRTNLTLIRRYNIPFQELPLLCQTVLEARREGEGQQAFTFAEDDMRRYAETVAARQEAARQRKSHRRLTTSRTGSAWRSPPR